MRQLSIGEVARRTGVRTSALRYYEEAGILPTPARVSGRRCYDADAIRRVDVLRFAQQAGFPLREIKTLFHGFGAETPLSGQRWSGAAWPPSGGAEEHADKDRGDAAPLQLHDPLAQHERREGERDQWVGAGQRRHD
jgi:DNA-binding transcriptional MerR regulator